MAENKALKYYLPLTEKEMLVYSYILGYVSDNNYPPTVREIAAEFNMTAMGADYFIKALINKGKIRLSRKRTLRKIKIVEHPELAN